LKKKSFLVNHLAVGLKVVSTLLRAWPGALLLGLMAGAPALAQPPVERFMRWPDLEQPRLSPDGRHAALLAQGDALRNTLVVLDVDKPGSARALVRFVDADLREVHWVGNDHLVFELTDRRAGGAAQRFAPGLYAVAREGGPIRTLVQSRVAFVTGAAAPGQRALPYSHELLHVPHDGSQEVIVGEWRFERGDFVGHVPKRLNVVTGRVRSLGEKFPDAGEWSFDPQGRPRMVSRQREGRRIVWFLPRGAGSTWQRILDADALALPFVPRFVDGHDGVLATRPTGAGGANELYRIEGAALLAGPDTEALRFGEPLVRTPGFDFKGQPLHDLDSGEPLGLRVLTDAETTVWFHPALQALQQRVDTALPGRVNRLECRRCTQPDAVVLVTSWSDRDPGQFWLFRGADTPPVQLGRERRDIVPAEMATQDLHRVATRDGLSMPVWLTQPASPGGAAPAPRPAVVLVHGGPWVRGAQWRWDAEAQLLASRGYVVIEPEFRGSTGYGRDWHRAGWRQWGGAMQDDVADAVRWAVGRGLVDPDRVCIAGASYGGYAVLAGLLRHPGLYRCGVAWVAVTEPRLLLEPSWWWGDDISEESRRLLPAMLGEGDALDALAIAPRAAGLKAPLLLAYGGNDRRVPLKHGRDLRAALEAAGRPPEWVVYDDEGHGWFLQANRVAFWRRVDAFLARHIGPPAAAR